MKRRRMNVGHRNVLGPAAIPLLLYVQKETIFQLHKRHVKCLYDTLEAFRIHKADKAARAQQPVASSLHTAGRRPTSKISCSERNLFLGLLFQRIWLGSGSWFQTLLKLLKK